MVEVSARKIDRAFSRYSGGGARPAFESDEAVRAWAMQGPGLDQRRLFRGMTIIGCPRKQSVLPSQCVQSPL
jgi:hypothetical protein